MRISAVIHTFNEEKNITGCLESLKKWVDEIIIIDMYSDDKTVQICKEYTDKILYFERMGFADPARKFGLEQPTGDWVLVLDADERIPSRLAEKLLNIAIDPNIDVVEIPEKNFMFGKWIRYTGWYPDHHPRFFRNGFVSFSEKVHGPITTKGKKIFLDPKDENNFIVHFNYVDCKHFIEKLNRYTTFEVEKLIACDEKFTPWKMVKKALHEAKSRYISRRGFKDGIRGLILSGFMGFYYFLVYAKLWEYNEFKKKHALEVYKEIDATMQDEYNNWEKNDENLYER